MPVQEKARDEKARAQKERRLREALRKMEIGRQGNIERDETLRDMMASRSHTWAELREMTGLSDGRLNQIRYRSR